MALTYLKVVATPPLDSTVPTDVALNFAISVDEDEATSVAECTAQPRAHQALALYQVQSTLSKIEVAAPGLPLSFACHQGCESKVHALDLHSPERRALSQHQRNDQTVSWLRQLRHAFNLDGFVECTEEGFVAYITTRFVDHSHNPQCDDSRPLRIAAVEIGSWKDQIMEAWRDKIDPTALTDIRLLSPTPPSTETETTLVHILLEQNRVDLTHSAGVISVIKQDRHHASLRHVAVSVGRMVSQALILRIMHLQDSCVLRRCAVTYRGVALRTGDLEDIESGFGLVVHVPPALANDILHTNVNHLQPWLPPWQLPWMHMNLKLKMIISHFCSKRQRAQLPKVEGQAL
jgi:hypothetical protein